MRARDLRAGEGGRALLLDRLVDLEPHRDEEERPFRTLTSEEVKASIRKEVGRVLNTRSTSTAEDLEDREWTVLDYGLPDYSGWFTRSLEDQRRLTRLVLKAIQSFEPRLHSPTVEIIPRIEGEQNLFLRIDGAVRVGDVMEPVSFPLALEPTREG